MHEGTPFIPGSIPGEAEGVVAQVARRDRTRFRVIPGGGAAKIVPITSRRPAPRRTRPTLAGVAAASAAGVIAGIFWCALLAFVGFKLRSRVGDAGAVLSVLAIQLAATAAAIALLRSRAALRAALSREGPLH